MEWYHSIFASIMILPLAFLSLTEVPLTDTNCLIAWGVSLIGIWLFSIFPVKHKKEEN